MPKGKRDREWDANADKLKNLPKSNGIYDTAGKVKKGEFEAFMEWVYQWSRDMHAWGQDVRDDIIRLEAHTGFPSGDPGDPPDGPPEAD